MNYWIFFSLLLFFSSSLLFFIFYRAMRKLQNNPEIFEQISFLAKQHSLEFYFNSAIKPFVLQKFEIFIRRIRLIVLKLEIFLFKIIDRLNGKRRLSKINAENSQLKNREPSPFLKELNNSKKKI